VEYGEIGLTDALGALRFFARCEAGNCLELLLVCWHRVVGWPFLVPRVKRLAGKSDPSNDAGECEPAVIT
jgi:hypothetical protein